MNIWLFPDTDNRLLRDLWDQQVHPLFQSLFAQKKVVDSHRPPTQDEIETFLAKSENTRIADALRRYDQLERELVTYKHHLNELALEEMYFPVSDDEKKAARTKFNQEKNKLTAALHSLAHIAAHDQEQRVVDWVESALTQVPKLNTTSNNHDLKAMREWLQKHHPEANIKSRGTIPLKWKTVYYNRSE